MLSLLNGVGTLKWKPGLENVEEAILSPDGSWIVAWQGRTLYFFIRYCSEAAMILK